MPEHLGTTDVDVLLITHVDPDADLGSVERALESFSFKPDPNEGGWRWRGPIEGVQVKLEFLCDLPDYREGEVIRPSGCRALSAQNLRGTRFFARDFAWEELSGELADGTIGHVRARFTSLEGLPSSPSAWRRAPAPPRRTTTTSSFSCCTTAREGRSRPRIRRLLNGEFAADLNSLRTTFLEVRERYVGIRPVGRSAMPNRLWRYSPKSTRRNAGRAVDVVQRFFAELDV